jgi:hypothetical protein
MVEENLIVSDIYNFLVNLQKIKDTFKFKITKNDNNIEIWIKQFKDSNIIENCYSFSSLLSIYDLVDFKNDIINEIYYN